MSTTCDSRTGTASRSSSLRCGRTAASADTSTVRPSMSKNRNPYPPPGVARAPGSVTIRTPAVPSRAASPHTPA
ncbi:hypothetical protein [Actinomadura geliboluensis]|uniref:hypothetical protein n=1 Tax=Actinomadura geliboluensis TaxID=882440 RepID=UPI00369F3D4A